MNISDTERLDWLIKNGYLNDFLGDCHRHYRLELARASIDEEIEDERNEARLLLEAMDTEGYSEDEI